MSAPGHTRDHALYHRLARAYPAGRRRDELLDTLIMAAEDGARCRPSAPEILDVLRHAPRAWLGRPGSRGVVVAAVIVSLLTGLVVGCLAARATAAAQYRPLPSAAELSRLGAVAAPGAPLTTFERYDEPVVSLNAESRHGFVHLNAAHDATTRDIRPYTEGVVTRLRQAGWRTAPCSIDGYRCVVAKNAGVVLYFETARWGDRPIDGTISITVQHAPSVWVFVAGGVGAGVGLVLGWLLAGWASRRTEQHPSAGGVLGVLTAFAAVPTAPLASDTLRDYRAGLSDAPAYTGSPFWGWIVPGDGLPPFTVPALLAVIGFAVVIVAGRPRPNGPSGTPAARTRPPRALSAALALAAAVAALLGAHRTGASLSLLDDRMTLLIVGVAAVTLLHVLVAPLRRPNAAEPRLDAHDAGR